MRSCVRCRREGAYAFRRLIIAGEERGWICSHSEPCVARARLIARRARRSGAAATPFLERPIAVIGSDVEATALIDQVLTELGSFDVDRLDATPASLARLTAREYGAVVVDTSASDPVWFLGELTRRLAPMGRRGIPIVACVTPGATGPGLTRLLDGARALTVDRPFEASDLIQRVHDAMEGVASHATGPADHLALSEMPAS
jgi:hypothetical protein